jgi:hypothetical protein
MFCVPNGVRGGIRAIVPQPTEWQRIGNQIDAAFISAWANFVNVRGYGKRFVVRTD